MIPTAPIVIPPSLALPVSENSQVGEARREFARLAAEAGLDSAACARVSLIVTELATNLVKHARQGELIARGLSEEGAIGLSIHSVDRGPGMKNLDQCQQDGFSTAGSPGLGLGTLRRQSDWFHTYSVDQVGTVISVGVVARPRTAGHLELGILIAPAPGETVCGDACTVVSHGNLTTLLMADGLGHGPLAADAAAQAVQVARNHPSKSPADLMRLVHDALRKTRGAAVAIGCIDQAARQLTFCGVGNISASLVRYGASKAIPSSNGIVGHVLPRLDPIILPWTGQDLLVFHSDGIHAHGKVFNLPGLLMRPAPVIAGMIYAQQKRGRDDASVLLARAHIP